MGVRLRWIFESTMLRGCGLTGGSGGGKDALDAFIASRIVCLSSLHSKDTPHLMEAHARSARVSSIGDVRRVRFVRFAKRAALRACHLQQSGPQAGGSHLNRQLGPQGMPRASPHWHSVACVRQRGATATHV